MWVNHGLLNSKLTSFLFPNQCPRTYLHVEELKEAGITEYVASRRDTVHNSFELIFQVRRVSAPVEFTTNASLVGEPKKSEQVQL